MNEKENNSFTIDFNSLSGIKYGTESNITSKIDNNSFNINNNIKGGSHIFQDTEPKSLMQWIINDLLPLNSFQKKNEINESFYSNAYEVEYNDSESKFNINEQSNKQENVLISSEINNDKSCEKLGNNVNNSFNDSSPVNIEICINNYEEENHTSFLGRKRKYAVDDSSKNQRRKSETLLDHKCKYIGILSIDTKNTDKEEPKKSNDLNDENKNKIKNDGTNYEENLRKNFYIFTPSENGNNLRRLIKNNVMKIEISSENSKIISEEKIYNLINKKSKRKGKRKRRKLNSDCFSKKIKTMFLKELKKAANKHLKSAGYRKQFKLLPPSFNDNLNKAINISIFNKTFEELFSINFGEIIKTKKKKIANIINYNNNKSVINYLKKNINYEKFYFLKMTYRQLYNEYLDSKEFEMVIDYLRKNKKEDDEYINNYIIKAYNFLNYFLK